MKDRIEKIITHYSSAVGEWINADGEGIETNDAYYDEDDLKRMTTELESLFESQKKEWELQAISDFLKWYKTFYSDHCANMVRASTPKYLEYINQKNKQDES